MKRLILVLSLCVPMMLAACSGKKEKNESAPPAPAPAAQDMPADPNAPAPGAQDMPADPNAPQAKPAEVKKEVEDAVQMREQENEMRMEEVKP